MFIYTISKKLCAPLFNSLIRFRIELKIEIIKKKIEKIDCVEIVGTTGELRVLSHFCFEWYCNTNKALAIQLLFFCLFPSAFHFFSFTFSPSVTSCH